MSSFKGISMMQLHTLHIIAKIYYVLANHYSFQFVTFAFIFIVGYVHCPIYIYIARPVYRLHAFSHSGIVTFVFILYCCTALVVLLKSTRGINSICVLGSSITVLFRIFKMSCPQLLHLILTLIL